jgi:hypothetical protein
MHHSILCDIDIEQDLRLAPGAAASFLYLRQAHDHLFLILRPSWRMLQYEPKTDTITSVQFARSQDPVQACNRDL